MRLAGVGEVRLESVRLYEKRALFSNAVEKISFSDNVAYWLRL